MAELSGCESCTNYVYNDDVQCYECLASMDEDDYYYLVSGSKKSCPYYRLDDEYGIVKKQM